MSEFVPVAYVVLLVALLAYGPLQIAALFAIDPVSWPAILTPAALMAVMHLLTDSGPDGPNFPPWPVVVTALVCDVVLVRAMIRSWRRR